MKSPQAHTITAIALAVPVFFVQFVYAQADCDVVFSDAAQTHNNGGKLEIKNNAKIVNSPDNVLDTRNINASNLSCVTVTCTQSGSTSQTGNYNTFPNGPDLDIQSSQTLVPGNYGELKTGENITLTLQPGDYTFRKKVEVGKNTTLRLQGGGTARIYSREDFLFKEDSALIMASSTDRAFLYTRKKIEIDKRVDLTAVLYSRQDFKLGENARVFGSVSGRDVTMETGSNITYDGSLISATDFNGFCNQVSSVFVDILVSTSASTCVPHDVTVRICADVACSSLNSAYTGIVNLSTSTSNGDWSESLADGILVPGAADSGAATFQFESGNAGSATLQLANTRAEQLTITATDSVDNSITDTSDTITFSDNALVIEDIDSLTEGAGGSDVSVAGRPHRYRVEFYRRDTSQVPANCAVASNYNNAAQPLKAWITRNTQLAAAVDPQIGVLTLPETQPAASNITLDFSSGGSAFFDLQTTDVGQYAIELLDDSRVFASNADVAGSSNQLTVRPFGFDIDIEIAGVEDRSANGTSGASYAADASGSAFIAAGSAFSVELSAVQWQAADDADDDGVPDVGANLTDNPFTANFGQENVAEQAVLSSSLIVPAGGAAGTLTGTTFSGFSGGQAARSDVSFSEVGIVQIGAQLASGSYLASGSNVSGVLSNVGRFIPASFATSAVVVSEACAAGAYSYMGEAFRVTYNLEAQNAAGATTTNYRGAFTKLDSGQGSIDYGAFAIASASDLSARLQPDGASFNAATTFIWGPSGGLAFGNAELGSNLILQRAASADGEHIATLGVLLTDADGSTSAPLNLDVDGGGNDYVTLATTRQRYGRVFVENAFGPETRDLQVPFSAEYFSSVLPPSGGFLPNTLDSCTVLAVSDFSEVAGSYTLNLDDADTSPTAVSGANFVAGKGSVTLSAPGGSNDGSVDIRFTVPDYLRFDWDANAGTADTSPENTATFGSYRGNDRVIYRREVLQ
ncbi:MAG: hypothetical protein HKO06_10355 [Pseudomonadales bacterium]|nr:hypothetical protein [Pseudomonadales bacterium]